MRLWREAQSRGSNAFANASGVVGKRNNLMKIARRLVTKKPARGLAMFWKPTSLDIMASLAMAMF